MWPPWPKASSGVSVLLRRNPPSRQRLRSRETRLAASSIVLGVVFALATFAAPARVLALGKIIQVSTASDVVADDGLCSLREAISVSNTGGFSGGNFGECEGTLDQDSIRFAIGSGTPQINVATALPTISAPVTINGNTGGATRVHIHGPNGTGTGLELGSASDGSTLRFLEIDNFLYGVFAGHATATVVGNVISGNNIGIFATQSSLTIGGVRTSNSTDQCLGDCNRISGNALGIYLELMESYSVRGNFIGVGPLGAGAQANTSNGILVSAGNGTIGGTTPGERNVISGNGEYGLKLVNCTCSVIGNFVGTDVTGNKAIPNGAGGMWVRDGHASVGGTAAGEGNLISGNTGHGLFVQGWSGLNGFSAYGNRLGVKDGGGALGNGGDGIRVHGEAGPVSNVDIGSEASGAPNVIAYNAGAGIRIKPCADRVTMRGNSIFGNTGQGIVIEPGLSVCPLTNGGIQPPSISGLSPISGTSCANCTVDIYSDSADEGRTWEGSVLANGSGAWQLGVEVAGPNVTATATDSNGNTSEFSAPYAVPPTRKPDGRIRKGTGSLIGNNVYNLTGVNQTKTGSTTRGSTITFGLSLQNDGASDTFEVRATGSTTSQYTVVYFRNSTNITSAVVAGTYTTPVLAKGDTFLITAKVKVNSSAAVGSSVTRLVTVTSVADSSKKDAVKFIGKRS